MKFPKLDKLANPLVLRFPFSIRLTIWWWQGQKRVGTKALRGIGFIVEM